jgi:nudix-type nucleoside diphosphatase (YffH/AdpP family)
VRDRILLVEQFRMGPWRRGATYPWMLEPVAGRVDPGETPESTARREAVEEAGLTLRGLERIGSGYPTPGYSTEYFHVFLGLCDLPDGIEGHHGEAEEHEDIRTHVLDWAQAEDLLSRGEADNMPLVLALVWLSRERSRLRATA